MGRGKDLLFAAQHNVHYKPKHAFPKAIASRRFDTQQATKARARKQKLERLRLARLRRLKNLKVRRLQYYLIMKGINKMGTPKRRLPLAIKRMIWDLAINK